MSEICAFVVYTKSQKKSYKYFTFFATLLEAQEYINGKKGYMIEAINSSGYFEMDLSLFVPKAYNYFLLASDEEQTYPDLGLCIKSIAEQALIHAKRYKETLLSIYGEKITKVLVYKIVLNEPLKDLQMIV